MTGEYDDIIDHPHHEPKFFPRMTKEKRAAQFSPFKALTGFEESVDEAARLTDARKILSEDQREEIDRTLVQLRAVLAAGQEPTVSVQYFVEDGRKEGGSYQTTVRQLRRIDDYHRQLIFEDGVQMDIKDIYELTFSEGWS